MSVLRAGFLVDVQRSFQHFPRQQRRNEDAPALLSRHLISDIAGPARVELWMRLLDWLRDYGYVVHVVVLAVIREFFFRKRQFQNVNRLVVARTTLFEWQTRGTEQPGVTASQTAFEAAIGEDVGFGNHAGEA